MNFLRDRKLARRLKNNEVSSKEQFIYYLIYSILIGILTSNTFSRTRHAHAYSDFMDALSIIMIIVTVFLSYIANNKGDKKDFVMRSICTSFPIFLQVIIIGLPLGFAATFLDNMALVMGPKLLAGNMSQEEVNAFSQNFQFGKFGLISLAIINIYTIWRTYTAMLIASGAKE